MAKKNKETAAPAKKKSSVADEAFRKKVTIIFGCVLLAFLIMVVAVIVGAWWNQKSAAEQFVQDKISAQAAAKNPDKDPSVIDIKVTDDTFFDWITELDNSYQAKEDEPLYHVYTGCTIELEGMFLTKSFKNSNYVEYWVYRKFMDANGKDAMICTEVKFDGKAPKDGTWVKVVGTVAPTGSLSCIKNATVTLMDEPGQEYLK